MTNAKPIDRWTRKGAVLLSLACLTAGIAGGWGIRASLSPAAAHSASAPASAAPAPAVAPSQPPARLKEMADAQAAPLLGKLKADPKNPELLTAAGNLYYDAQQYPVAIDYYTRALEARPSDAAVRTDMATAYWYMGNADTAIAEFNKALAFAPANPNTLFNLGVVKWRGKKDAAGALADWEKLLKANPSYDGRANVEKMMAEASGKASAKP
jgi:tetratricopeptide (TPR) repeat protein